MKLAVNEVFCSLQGEGRWTGSAAIFVRFQGCDVGCPWCDTRHTWKVDDQCRTEPEKVFRNGSNVQLVAPKTPELWSIITLSQLLNWKATHAPKVDHIVLTGGEPLMHNLLPLVHTLEKLTYRVQIETSGTEPIPKFSEHTWITLSPKFDMPGGKLVRNDALMRADEVKLPLTGSLMRSKWLLTRTLSRMDEVGSNAPLYLQPISLGKEATRRCIQLAIENGLAVSVQTHKYLEVL